MQCLENYNLAITLIFGKDIQSLNPKTNKLSRRVGEAIGDETIARMWGDYFSTIPS